PIRVAGDSGPLIHETSWDEIATLAGCPAQLQEFTSVTHKLRRVGHFDPELVRKAIMVNEPTRLVLNHVDYVDWKCRAGTLTAKAIAFIQSVETSIGRRIDSVGTSETTCVPLLRHQLA